MIPGRPDTREEPESGTSLPDQATSTAGTLLMRIGEELSELGQDLDRVQDALSPVLAPTLLSHPEAVEGLQHLDRVSQAIQALSLVTHRLSRGLSGQGWPSDEALFGDLHLGDLVHRLARSDEPDLVPRPTASDISFWD